MSVADFTKLVQEYSKLQDGEISFSLKDEQVGYISSQDRLLPLGITGFFQPYDIETGLCLNIKYHPTRNEEFDKLSNQFLQSNNMRHYNLSNNKGQISIIETIKPEFKQQYEELVSELNMSVQYESELYQSINNELKQICTKYQVDINIRDRDGLLMNVIDNFELENNNPKYKFPEEWFNYEEKCYDWSYGNLLITMLKKSELYQSLLQANLITK